MTNYDVMKLALEAMKYHRSQTRPIHQSNEAIVMLEEALANQPTPPPECQTDAEKTAFAFGWWKALEHIRMNKTGQYSDIVSDGGMDPRN